MSALPQPSTLLPPHHGPHQDIMMFWCWLWEEGSWRPRSCGVSQGQARSIPPLRPTHTGDVRSPQPLRLQDYGKIPGVDWGVESLVDASALRPTIRARSLGARGRRRSCVTRPRPSHPALWRDCLIRWSWSILLQVRRLRSQHRTELSSHILNQGGGAAAAR